MQIWFSNWDIIKISSHHCPFFFLHSCSLFLEVFAIIKSVSDKDPPYFSGKLWVTIYINKRSVGGAFLDSFNLIFWNNFMFALIEILSLYNIQWNKYKDVSFETEFETDSGCKRCTIHGAISGCNTFFVNLRVW